MRVAYTIRSTGVFLIMSTELQRLNEQNKLASCLNDQMQFFLCGYAQIVAHVILAVVEDKRGEFFGTVFVYAVGLHGGALITHDAQEQRVHNIRQLVCGFLIRRTCQLRINRAGNLSKLLLAVG